MNTTKLTTRLLPARSFQSTLGIFVLACISTSGCGSRPSIQAKSKEAWNPINNPIKLLPANYILNFQQLPLTGATTLTPWSETYWPSNRGGLATRWALNQSGHQVTDPVTPEQAAGMTEGQLANLSPAEKYDIFVGDQDLSLFHNELQRTSPNSESWDGICHGWASASLSWTQPKAVIVAAPSGVKVPFAASDIKALLSLYTGEYSTMPQPMVGARCDADLNADPSAASTPRCRDTNAGAFHLILTNLLGLQHKGFVADITRDVQVWNQPIIGFTSRVTQLHDGRAEDSAPTAVRTVDIETTMQYALETKPQWPQIGTAKSAKLYRYRLEIDAAGSIVGGAWLTEDRPDFVWTMEKPTFEDTLPPTEGQPIDWTKLQTILDASAAESTDAAKPVQ